MFSGLPCETHIAHIAHIARTRRRVEVQRAHIAHIARTRERVEPNPGTFARLGQQLHGGLVEEDPQVCPSFGSKHDVVADVRERASGRRSCCR